MSPKVILEFGARSTGEPNETKHIICEVDGHIPDIIFPTSTVRVMKITRTFWEKATAAHVYCVQQHLRGERYSRHWYDLAMLIRSEYYYNILDDLETAKAVIQHKSFFFIEKDANGNKIDYTAAISGKLCLVPEGNAHSSRENDYTKMIEDGVLINTKTPFNDLIKICAQAQDQINNRYQRLILAKNVLAYKTTIDEARLKTLAELSEQAQKLKMGYDE